MPHNIPPFYTQHLFICTNRVDDPRCCGARDSEALFLALRRVARQAGRTDIAITRTGCMGRCMSGPALVIYPDNIWYAPRCVADIETIFRQHIQTGEIVTALRMPAQEPPLPGYDLSHSQQIIIKETKNV